MSGTLRIQVRLFANLRDRFPPQTRGRGELELPAGASLQDALDALAIDDRQSQMVLVEGQQVSRGRDDRRAIALADGATVSVFPPLAGG